MSWLEPLGVLPISESQSITRRKSISSCRLLEKHPTPKLGIESHEVDRGGGKTLPAWYASISFQKHVVCADTR